MNRDSIIDYSSCILVKALGFLIGKIPRGFVFFLGRRLGDALYYFDLKHKAVAYSNIKTALGASLSASKLSHLTRDFYRSFGQTIMEVFLFRFVDKKYLDKYITFEGLDNIASGFKRGRGVILAVMHEGSWEMSNIISANLGYPFNIIVREQPKFQRLNDLLNLYREQKGSKLIRRQDQTREIIRALKDNEAIAMTVDQGGRTGSLVNFFGRPASMSTGAVKLALKFGAAIIPVFSTRIRGPYIKFFIEPPLEIKETGDTEKDVTENLQSLVALYERYLLKYPEEYLWTYKIWKYGRVKDILILNDGRTGHLRQAQGLADIIGSYLKEKGEKVNLRTVEVKFKNKLSHISLALGSLFGGRYSCQGCLWCFRKFLQQDTYGSLNKLKPDIIISCGSSIAPVNFILSRQNLAKSVVIMRPSILSTRRFDLVVMGRHDSPGGRGLPSVRQSHSQSHRPQGRNIVVIDGALNLINEKYLEENKSRLSAVNPELSTLQDGKLIIGLLIGGDAKSFHLSEDLARKLIAQVKQAAEKLDGQILITTSRRTPEAIERLLKKEFKDYPRCKLLIIANEKNIPEAVGGILALSRVIITSPESISMVSEAASSKKYALVFKSRGLSKKHKRFLAYFAKNKYIYLTEADNLSQRISDIWLTKPEVHTLRDDLLVAEAIKRIL